MQKLSTLYCSIWCGAQIKIFVVKFLSIFFLKMKTDNKIPCIKKVKETKLRRAFAIIA
mgnify:CR=1 FL=1